MLMPMPMLYAAMQSLQPCSHDSHRDFSASAAYAATAAMEMSQPCAYAHAHAHAHRHVI